MTDPDHSANQLNREELERITGKEQPEYVPSTPDPQLTTLVAALLRHLLTILSGAGIVGGTYTNSMLMTVAGGIVGVGTVAWSIWQKIQAAKRDHLGSVRSAQIKVPVKAETT